MYNIFSPLEEFSVSILGYININKSDVIGVSNSVLLLLNVVYLIFYTLKSKSIYFYIYMNSILVERNLEIVYSIYIEIYSYLLYYIGCNLLGLLNESIVLSGLLLSNIYLSLSIMLLISVLGILKYDIYLLRSIGLNIFLDIFVLIIEYISFFSRILSLSVRISFNIICSHLLLKILISVLMNILYIEGFGLLLLCIYTLINTIFILEIYISYLQGFIYSILLYIYSKEMFLS